MKRIARQHREPTTEPTADQKLAYTICYWIYGQGCECRERSRGQVCDAMMSAGFAARRQIENEAK